MRRPFGVAVAPALAVLVYALVLAVVAGLLGCASVCDAHGNCARPGLRVLAVCYGDDGRLREVKAYPISRTFALQNTALGAVVGAGVGAFFGVAPAGAAVGAGAGLLSDALRAVGEVAGEALEQEPACTYPAPPLRPDEADLPPPPKPTTVLDLQPERPLARGPLVWEPVRKLHEAHP